MSILKFEQSLKELQCTSCNYSLTIPYHCGRQMVVKDNHLVCWKGEHQPCCNSSSKMDIPIHHDQFMIIKNN